MAAVFREIYERAVQRKGGSAALESLLAMPLSDVKLRSIAEDRFLATMTRCVNQAGFSWRVIDNKWPQFEEAFFGFRVDALSLLSDEQWEAYLSDRRVVRSWQKIQALKANVAWLYEEKTARDGIAALIARWPSQDYVGLLAYLKSNGSRLGGNSGQRFLRYMGKDSFILTRDVISSLIGSGVDIKPAPSSQRELAAIQDAFNQWHEESARPLTQLSQIAAFSVGENHAGMQQ